MPEVERVLRHKARQLLQSGALPLAKPLRSWGGYGVGIRCNVCEQPIGKDQIEYEIQFLGEDAITPYTIHLHLACNAVWELERRLMERASVS